MDIIVQTILFSSVVRSRFPSVATEPCPRREKLDFILFQFQELPQFEGNSSCALFSSRTTKVFWKHLIDFDMKVNQV